MQLFQNGSVFLLVDGQVYQRQPLGGINRVFDNLLPRLARSPGIRLAVTGIPTKTRVRLNLPDQCATQPWRVAARVLGAWRRKPYLFQSSFFAHPPLPGARHVALVQDMNHEIFPHWYNHPWGSWLRARYRRHVTEAALVLCPTEKTKSDVMKYYGRSSQSVSVVPYGVDRGVFFYDDARLLPTPYFLFVGMRHKYKNFEFLFRSWARSPLRHELDLVVVGPPWSPREQAMFSELKLEPRLFQSTCDVTLRRLYSHACALIYPSLHEGFGLPLLEAMACQCPVVCSDTEVFREVAGSAALYFAPDNSSSLTDALKSALGDPHSLRRRGTGHCSEFSWERTTEGFLEAYRRVSGGRA